MKWGNKDGSCEATIFEVEGLLGFHMVIWEVRVCCGTLAYQLMLPHRLIKINIKIRLIANNYNYIFYALFHLLNILKHTLNTYLSLSNCNRFQFVSQLHLCFIYIYLNHLFVNLYSYIFHYTCTGSLHVPWIHWSLRPNVQCSWKTRFIYVYCVKIAIPEYSFPELSRSAQLRPFADVARHVGSPHPA